MTIIIDHTDSQYAYIKFQLISENSSQGVTEKKYYELYDTNICLQNFINSSGINFAACDD
jgi:hypothetical protein